MGHQRNENGAVQLSSKNPHKVALKEEEEEGSPNPWKNHSQA